MQKAVDDANGGDDAVEGDDDDDGVDGGGNDNHDEPFIQVSLTQHPADTRWQAGLGFAMPTPRLLAPKLKHQKFHNYFFSVATFLFIP